VHKTGLLTTTEAFYDGGWDGDSYLLPTAGAAGAIRQDEVMMRHVYDGYTDLRGEYWFASPKMYMGAMGTMVKPEGWTESGWDVKHYGSLYDSGLQALTWREAMYGYGEM
jgi:hypothetical protein